MYLEQHRKSTETKKQAADRISDVILNDVFTRVAAAYLQLCGVKLKCIQTHIPEYISDADNCPNKDSKGQCTCIPDSSCTLEFYESPFINYHNNSHCNNASRLRNNLITNIPNNTIRISFTGHKMCFYSNSGGHTYRAVAGLSSSYYPIIIINEHIGDDPKEFVLVMFHEIGHLYGLTHQHPSELASTCVMKGRDDHSNIKIYEYGKYLCPNCINTVKLNKHKHHDWR